MSREALEKELQRKYLQLQMYKHQFNAYVEEKGKVEEKLSEIRMTLSALEKLENVKNGEEIWSSLGSNAFVMSSIKDTENVLVSIGAGVVVKSTRKQSMDILQSNLNELDSVNRSLAAEIIRYKEEIDKLEPEVHKLAQQL